MKKILLSCLVFLLFLTGCVHHSPYDKEYFFQAMGEDSEIIITMDADRLKDGGYLIGYDDPLLKELIKRSERVNIAFHTDTENYPSQFSDYSYYGGLEGNYGPLVVNNALRFNKDFEEVESDGISFFRSDLVEAKVPRGGLLVFSSDDYPSAYQKTVKNREIYIDPTIASRLGDSVIGLYLKDPKTIIDLGFDLPQTVIQKMREAIVYILEDGSDLSLNADITMENESSARTMTTLLRNWVLFNFRKMGKRPDIQELSKKYYYEGDSVKVRNHTLTKETLSKLTRPVTK